MKSQNKIAMGSALAVIGASGMALSIILEWTSMARPWGFLLGFAVGICAGAGVALAIAGLLECRKAN